MPNNSYPYTRQDVSTWSDADFVDAMRAGQGLSLPVSVVSYANISITSLPATIDGRTMLYRDRFVLAAQTDPAENGVYEYSAAGMIPTLIKSARDMENGRKILVRDGSFAGHELAVSSYAIRPLALDNHGLLWRAQIQADILHTGDTAVTTLGSITIPGVMVNGLRRSIRFKAMGLYGANAGGKTLTTTLRTGTAVNPASCEILHDSGAIVHIQNRQWIFEGELYVRVLGAATTAKVNVRSRFMEESIPTAAEVILPNTGTNFRTDGDVNLLIASESNDAGNENTCTHLEAEVYAA